MFVIAGYEDDMSERSNRGIYEAHDALPLL